VTQHHCYAVEGTDPVVFREIGVRRTTEDTSMEYFVHDHQYSIDGSVSCNARCQLIKRGIVANVTRMELHDSPTDV
jgi:hypothetical protein